MILCMEDTKVAVVGFLQPIWGDGPCPEYQLTALIVHVSSVGFRIRGGRM